MNEVYVPSQANLAMRNWFQDAKFGLFIHWGLYSVLGQGEWVMENNKMTIKEYERLATQFNPDRYDPAEWVALTRQAGMSYITITTKHHDGFALWASKVGDWNIIDRTNYKRDVIKMLADECQRQGMRLFFYHSHLDWHHPDYYPRGVTGRHAGRPDQGNFVRYLDDMDTQIAELCGGQYGSIAGFWFDGCWDQQLKRLGRTDAHPMAMQVDWRFQQTYSLIHRLQPQALIGSNHHLHPLEGEDFQIIEKDLPGQNTAGFSGDTKLGELPLETCETIPCSNSWGYNKNDQVYRSSRELIHYLVRAAGSNANFLLNIGPMPSGRIQPEFVERLQQIGAWLAENGDSIHGTRGGPIPPQSWGVTTRKGDEVYVHVLDAEPGQKILLPLADDLQVRRARMFKDGCKVSCCRDKELILQLPAEIPDAIDTIIVLDTCASPK